MISVLTIQARLFTLGKLLPQDKLNAIMADHYNTFITDFDLAILKDAHIHSLRISVSYNVFLPEANRTDNFPHGERKALDQYAPYQRTLLTRDLFNGFWTMI